jgi:dienelactone hydrolase
MKRRPILFGLSGLLLLLALSGCVSLSGNASGWSVPRRSLDAQVALIAPAVDIRVPENATGPVPAAILLHGCGGRRALQDQYADALVEAGMAAIIVDSNRPRGIGRFGSMSQVCTALRLWGQERAADIPAAITIAETDPRLDATRLALVGWSHGGWTVLDALGYSGRGEALPALTDGPVSLAGAIDLAVLFYPYCGFPVGTRGDDLDPAIPVDAVLAEDDLIAPHGDCERLLERAQAAGLPAAYSVWNDVTHAFDDPDLPADPRMRHDAEASERARDHLVARLQVAWNLSE